MSITTGTYKIINVETGNCAGLVDNEVVSEVRVGHNEQEIQRILWKVTDLGVRGKYSIQNVSSGEYAFCPVYAKEREVVSSSSTRQQWAIQQTAKKTHFVISPSSVQLFWNLEDEEIGTPIVLSKNPMTAQSHWRLEEYNPTSPNAPGARPTAADTIPQPVFKAATANQRPDDSRVTEQPDVEMEDATSIPDLTANQRMPLSDFGRSTLPLHGATPTTTLHGNPVNTPAIEDDAVSIDSTIQNFRKTVFQTLDNARGVSSSQSEFDHLKGTMNLYPFSLYYLTVFLSESGMQTSSQGSIASHLKIWAGWDFVTTLVKHGEIRDVILKMLNEVEMCSFGQWPIVLKAALVNDRVDMSLSISKAAVRPEFRNVLALNDNELAHAMEIIQSFVDEKCPNHHQLEELLWKIVRNRGILPNYLFVDGAQKLQPNPVAAGGYADVWKGSIQDKVVALKELRLFTGDIKSNAFKDIAKEAIVWRQLKHRNVVSFYGCCKDLFAPRYALISPWMENGDMMTYLEKHPDTNRILLIYGVASGISYLHNEKQVVHGDIRGSNVLIDGNLQPRIADFGLTRLKASGKFTATVTEYSGQGTSMWKAPELFHEDHWPTPESDVYAFACVCIEIFTDQSPFPAPGYTEVSAMLKVIKGGRPDRPRGVAMGRGLNDDIWKLMENCWKQDPAERLAISDVVRMLSDSGNRPTEEQQPPAHDFILEKLEIFVLPSYCLDPQVQQLKVHVA
ncbi:kinase-like protein [Rickenella mellea]|uniref:Kinase-like protein n=1 Tax=Rickenella mellea TaxID=50990 RepID=A0A4Y7Q877_9AGAM|nr:kinase-like protein [Rickenella mellea]